MNSSRAWERRSCNLHFPKASTNSERVRCTYTLSETCSWRPWASEHTHANSCWKALLGDHPCYRANHTFCCLNTDLKAKSEALAFEAGRPQTGGASWTTCSRCAGYAWPGFLYNKNEIWINFIEDIHEYFRNRFLCLKQTPGLVVLKIPSESTGKKGTLGGDIQQGWARWVPEKGHFERPSKRGSPHSLKSHIWE